jgi:hypothetical protein
MPEEAPMLSPLGRELEELRRRYPEEEEIAPDILQLVRELKELKRRYPEGAEEIQRFAREEYARLGGPGLVEIAAGRVVAPSRGEEPVEVVPSDCERLQALDDLVRLGLGTGDVAREKEIISSVRARLAADIDRERGISLDQLRAQCPDAGAGP